MHFLFSFWVGTGWHAPAICVCHFLLLHHHTWDVFFSAILYQESLSLSLLPHFSLPLSGVHLIPMSYTTYGISVHCLPTWVRPQDGGLDRRFSP